jgi:CPA1 family monovalent cation:H+ antiporter
VDASILEQLILLISVGAVVAIVAHRLRIPYTVGLVLAGIVIAFLPLRIDLPFSKDFLFEELMPPLILEAARYIEWRELRRELLVVGAYATLGVLISAVVTAAIMHFVVGWMWPPAIVFGVLIAATDPVSVIAAFRQMRCEPRLSMVVESESLLNDGVAAVGFAVLSAIAAGASTSAASILPQFLWTLGGGVAIGLAVSAAILLIAGRTDDPVIEITLTTIAAYGSFLIAEQVHASGIISALTAGLAVGNIGWGAALSDESKNRVRYAWEYFAFLANSFVFILIGMNTASLPLRQLGWTGAIAILLVLVGRALSIYPLATLFAASRWRLPASYQHILFWGGLRGALALALALALPPTVAERGAIIVTAFVVVAFSILVQGLTMPAVIKRFRLDEPVAAPAGPG